MTTIDTDRQQHLETLLEITRRYRKLSSVPLNPLEDQAIDWLKDEIDSAEYQESKKGELLNLYSVDPGEWLVNERGSDIPVTYRGDAFEVVADIFSYGVAGPFQLHESLSVASMRRKKDRVVSRLEEAGAQATADYIKEHLVVKNDRSVLVKRNLFGSKLFVGYL